ncbi:MAG: hypothetical protein NWT00_01140, partial [Beijerinckiaceae bacterium]|nr:hypothetical protein [Beijerinckiaceae bacterium]
TQAHICDPAGQFPESLLPCPYTSALDLRVLSSSAPSKGICLPVQLWSFEGSACAIARAAVIFRLP